VKLSKHKKKVLVHFALVCAVLAIIIAPTAGSWWDATASAPSGPATGVLTADESVDVSRIKDRPSLTSRAYVRPATPAPIPTAKPKTPAKKTTKPTTTRRNATVPQHFGTAYLVAMAACIRHHESGVYTRNSGNGYYGAYQISDRMWHTQTGLPGHASDYPKAVQDYWFMKIWSKLKTDAVRQQQWVTYKYCSYIRP